MSRRRTKFVLPIGLCAVVILFFIARLPPVTHVKFMVIDTMSLPMRIVSFPFLELKKMMLYHVTFEENRRLVREVGRLRAQLASMEEYTRENTRLERLLNLQDNKYTGVAANVIARDISNWNSAVVIDKGTRHGVAVGMPVVDASGVVGKVIEVNGHRAKIILISDPSFSIAAMVQRSREVGLVSGTLTGQCRMRYLSSNADIQAGDQVIASKLSTSFPQGLLIGTVVSVEYPAGSPFPACLIKPAAPLSRIEEVIVITRSTGYYPKD